MRHAIATFLLVGCTLWAAVASPVDGTWAFTLSSPMGAVDATVTLKADGTTLTGTFDLGEGRVWTLEQGTITGNDVSFVLTRDRPSGGTMAYDMKGTIAGDTIRGTAAAMDAVVEWTMTRKK